MQNINILKSANDFIPEIVYYTVLAFKNYFPRLKSCFYSLLVLNTATLHSQKPNPVKTKMLKLSNKFVKLTLLSE